jgi:hypothetical protein
LVTCTTQAYEKQTNKQTKNKQKNVADLGSLITTVPLQNELTEILLYEYQINTFDKYVSQLTTVMKKSTVRFGTQNFPDAQKQN